MESLSFNICKSLLSHEINLQVPYAFSVGSQYRLLILYNLVCPNIVKLLIHPSTIEIHSFLEERYCQI